MTNFLDIAEEFSTAEGSRVHIIPVPYDATSTYRKGADRGPRAMIDASAQVEWFDIETRTEPHLQGIHTQSPVLCESDEPADLSPMVGERVGAVLDAGKLPVVLGGEHSVSIGAILAASERYTGLTVLQIDAHGDTRESYHGSTHNHACVMARAREVAGIVQVGIRAIDRSEWEAFEPGRVFFAHEILGSADDSWMEEVLARCTEHVYLTFDLDAFDPSLLPATGTPEPGGLDWRTVNELVRRVCRERTVVGFDVVELCPHEAHHASDFIAAKLVHRLISECLAARSG
ncbi:MAG: agmatinase [Phycisphaerales bacterium]|nr:agmatinase [Phycisphaerales bacterium]